MTRCRCGVRYHEICVCQWINYRASNVFTGFTGEELLFASVRPCTWSFELFGDMRSMKGLEKSRFVLVPFFPFMCRVLDEALHCRLAQISVTPWRTFICSLGEGLYFHRGTLRTLLNSFDAPKWKQPPSLGNLFLFFAKAGQDNLHLLFRVVCTGHIWAWPVGPMWCQSTCVFDSHSEI